MIEKRKIILDCDPGHDDAIAIMLLGAFPEKVQFAGITTVAGNQTVDKTFFNARRVTEYLGLDIPVYRGCEGPLLRSPVLADDIHGETGLDGFTFHDLKRSPETEQGVLWMLRTLREAAEPMTILATGPMTNLAMALRLEPEIAGKIREIVFMGGAMGLGNVTPAAEFNMFADPEAASIVLSSGCPLVMAGLDVTMQALCSEQMISRMAGRNNPAARLFKDTMTSYCAVECKTYNVTAAPLHDPVAAAWLLRPELIELKPMHVTVDCTGREGYGRTYCDYYGKGGGRANCRVALQLEADAFWDLIEEAICRYGA